MKIVLDMLDAVVLAKRRIAEGEGEAERMACIYMENDEIKR